MRFRLLQARLPADPVREEERAAFAEQLCVPAAHIEPFDLLAEPAAVERVADGVDAVLVGGAGHFSVLDGDPWIRAFIDLMGGLADAAVPTFASCFGFQALVLALGGRVARDVDNAEVGTFEVRCNGSAGDDPLFSALPAAFRAQMGHKDRATALPSGVVNVAASARCPYQAIRVGDGPVVATQFHPELSGDANRARFERYRREYVEALGRGRVEAIEASFAPSPEANGLLRRFASGLTERSA